MSIEEIDSKLDFLGKRMKENEMILEVLGSQTLKKIDSCDVKGSFKALTDYFTQVSSIIGEDEACLGEVRKAMKKWTEENKKK